MLIKALFCLALACPIFLGAHQEIAQNHNPQILLRSTSAS